jgi:hypothetical protein
MNFVKILKILSIRKIKKIEDPLVNNEDVSSLGEGGI